MSFEVISQKVQNELVLFLLRFFLPYSEIKYSQPTVGQYPFVLESKTDDRFLYETQH